MTPRDAEREKSTRSRMDDVPVATTVVRECMERTLLTDLQTIRGRGAVDRSVLTEKIRSVCQDAHERGLHAEQVIILIKEMWAELRPPLTFDAIQDQNERLNAVVSLTIQEFYGPQTPPA